MNVGFLPFILLSLAAYRITRFLIHDSLIGMGDGSGTKLADRIDYFGYNEDGSNRTFLRGKFADLLTCHFCLSFWVSCGLLTAWTWSWPWTSDSPQSWVITAFAVSGVVALIYEWIDRPPVSVFK